MWVKALFLVLFAGAAFMLWDVSRRNKADAAHRPRPSQATARPRIKRGPPLFALSLMFLLLALVELVHPRTPPFAGALGHWLEGVHDALGLYGIAAVWFVMACIGAGVAWLAWQRDQASPDTESTSLRES